MKKVVLLFSAMMAAGACASLTRDDGSDPGHPSLPTPPSISEEPDAWVGSAETPPDAAPPGPDACTPECTCDSQCGDHKVCRHDKCVNECDCNSDCGYHMVCYQGACKGW